MRKRRIIPAILAIAIWVNANGQHHIFRSYSMSDGLTNNAVRKIYQDSQGFIWICTWEGLNKFEGHKFTPFTTGNGLPHSMVNDILEVSPGLMIVALNDGTLSYIHKGRLTSKTLSSRFIINQLLNDPGKGLLGVSDRYGLVKIDSNKIIRISQDDDFSLYEIIIWKDFFLTIGDPSPAIVYDKNLKLFSKSRVTGVFPYCIYKGSNDQVFIGTQLGLRSIDMSKPMNPVIRQVPAPFDHPLLKKGSITAIYRDQTGHWWFGTHSGLVEVTPAGITRVYTEKDGLPGNRITCIMADREKNLWIGTYSGLAKLPYQSVDVVLPSNGQYYNGPLRAIGMLTPSEVGFVAVDAVYGYNLKSNSLRKLLQLEPWGHAVRIKGRNPFSVIYNNKTYSWNALTFSLEPSGSFPSRYYFAAAQYQKTICAAHNGIIIQFGNGSTIQILDSVRMHTLIWDKQGRILAGSWDRGLYRITVDTINSRVTRIEDLSYIPNASLIRALHADGKGNIWAGTRYNGVLILTENGDGNFKTRQISQASGLISDWIHDITEAPDGNMWIGSLAGISKIISSDHSYRIFNFSKAFHFYSEVNGLAVSDNDQFWGISDNGVFTFKDLQLEKSPPLSVYFSSIRLGNTDSNYASGVYGRKTRLRYNENYASFEFSSPGFINEKDLYYSYRLWGSSDTSWSKPSNLHNIEFASLNAGHYVFEVKMMGWNGQYGPVARFPFVINRPFWQSIWFYLCVALVLTLVLLSIMRYRTQQVLKLLRLRNAIASDLHDDIGASLTNISILSQLSLNSLAKPDDAKKFISRISDEVETSNQALDDIIWSVDSHHDTLDETLARMRRYVGDLFDNSSTRYYLDIAGDGTNVKLNMEQRRDLFLIFKEALNNILKHAGAGNAWINITVSNHSIRVSVTDDGAGFDDQAQTNRNGLKNIRFRVDKWKGDLRIYTRPASGTRIEITMPVAAP